MSFSISRIVCYNTNKLTFKEVKFTILMRSSVILINIEVYYIV